MEELAMSRLAWILAGLTALLAGCTSIGTINSSDPENKICGTLQSGLLAGHSAEVNLDGKAYRGKWKADYPTADQKAAATYPHKKHLNQLYLDLTANDGSLMVCRGPTDGLVGNLICTTGGRDYPVELR
jgi:hypothetical protein